MVSSITFTLLFAPFIDLNCKSVPTFCLKTPTPEPILLTVSVKVSPAIHSRPEALVLLAERRLPLEPTGNLITLEPSSTNKSPLVVVGVTWSIVTE